MSDKKLLLKDEDDRVKIYSPDKVYLGTIFYDKVELLKDIRNNDIVFSVRDSDNGNIPIAYFPISTTKYVRRYYGLRRE